MHIRHRIPTIFSIYMVDVLCCALGCVVLLWQVNFFEAEEQTAAAKKALEDLKNASVSVNSLDDENKNLRDELTATREREVKVILRLRELTKDRNELQQLALVRLRDYENAKAAEKELQRLYDQLSLDHEGLKKKSDLSAAELAKSIRLGLDHVKMIEKAKLEMSDLEKDLALKKKKLDDLNALLASADGNTKKLLTLLTDSQMSTKEYQDKLKLFDLRHQILQQDLAKDRKDLLDTRKNYQELLLAQELLKRRVTLSSKELEEAVAMAATLKGDNLDLLKKAQTLQFAVEKRFAGITLTGTRVVFLVDMSGSMELIEEAIAEPDKWPIVCATVGKIMESLPNLQQYQVILFSDRARYPLGGEGGWHDYAPGQTAKATVDALKAVKPKGETNMYVGFAEAFSFRDKGLDTVYVLSDGLPTSGDGLPANAKNLSETQKTEMLGKYLRTRLKTDWNRSLANRPRVRINTIGFFYESPEVGAFLWALAREHDGSFVGMSKP